MTEPITLCRREPNEAEKQARAGSRAERMALTAIARIQNKTGLPRYRVVATLFRLMASERG